MLLKYIPWLLFFCCCFFLSFFSLLLLSLFLFVVVVVVLLLFSFLSEDIVARCPDLPIKRPDAVCDDPSLKTGLRYDVAVYVA